MTLGKEMSIENLALRQLKHLQRETEEKIKKAKKVVDKRGAKRYNNQADSNRRHSAAC